MIWVIDNPKDESYQIIGTNIFNNEGTFQLWGTKPSAKTVMIISSEVEEDMLDYKKAIDFAIKTGEKTFTIE